MPLSPTVVTEEYTLQDLGPTPQTSPTDITPLKTEELKLALSEVEIGDQSQQERKKEVIYILGILIS
jgi:hypothetical protein